MNSFYRIRLKNITESIEEDLANYCFKFGASGLSEGLSFSQPDLTYEPYILHKKNHEVDVFFEAKPSGDFFSGLTELSPRIQWESHEEEQKDWLAEWKRGFQPFQLAGPYWIVPSWFTPPAEAKFPVLIDPGMAFGTGTHATTRMASYFVHKVGRKLKPLEKQKFLDVGTGTALLAILAEHEEFQSVLGIEIDPEARRVARENVQRNNCQRITISELLLEEVRDDFEVIVANIIDGVLIALKNDLIRVLKPGGHLFVTGILTEREEFFFEKFIENSPFEVVRRLTQDEWVGYWLKKRELE